MTVVMKMWGIFMLSLELGQKGPGETGLLGLLAPKSLQAMLYKYIYMELFLLFWSLVVALVRKRLVLRY